MSIKFLRFRGGGMLVGGGGVPIYFYGPEFPAQKSFEFPVRITAPGKEFQDDFYDVIFTLLRPKQKSTNKVL